MSHSDTLEEKYRRHEQIHGDLIKVAKETIALTKDVSTIIKNRLENNLRYIEITANLLSDALIIINSSGFIQYINPSGEKMFGWSYESIKNKNITTLFARSEKTTLSFNDLITILQQENCFDYNTSVRSINSHLKGVKQQNIFFDIDISGSNFVDANQEMYILIIRDVTEHEIHRNCIYNKEYFYRDVFSSSANGMVLVHNDVIIETNAKFHDSFNIKFGESILDIILSNNDKDLLIATLQKHSKGQNVPLNIKTNLKAKTTTIEAMLTCSALHNKTGSLSLITIVDLTNIDNVISKNIITSFQKIINH